MPAPLTRCLSVLVALCAWTVSLPAQSPHSLPTRRPPTRASSSVRIDGTDYVPVSELERLGGLKASWIKRGERLALTNSRSRIELDADSREAQVDGVRLYLGDSTRLARGTILVSRADLEKALLPIVQPAIARSTAPDMRIIALDPGHGGEDNGAMNSKLGLKEKVFALDVALRVKKLLEAQGYKVVMTRSEDSFVPLALRSEFANRAGADLFVSIHFNSLYPDTKTSGVEIYTFPPRGQHSVSSWGNKKEDAEDDAAPVNRFDQWSSIAAYYIQKDLTSSLGSFDRGKKLKHLGVLRGLNCPGVLIESAFLSSEAEGRKVATPAYRQQTAESIARGIQSYARTVLAVKK